MAIQVGTPAPDFKAQSYLASSDEFKEISLKDYEGKWLCLYFYPMDFTFVCPTEIVAFDNLLGDFQDRECELLTCSCDSHYVHKGWCAATESLSSLKHPMLADTTKKVSEAFDVLLPEKGVSLRGTFLIDPNGIVRWASVNDLTVGRNVDEVLRILDALQTDELCPCNWKKGDETL